MANTYNSTISSWSRISTALRTFALTLTIAVTDFARYVVRHVVGWVRRAAGRPYLSLAERLPLAGLNARETFHLRAAKRGRPTVTPRWRMCASV